MSVDAIRTSSAVSAVAPATPVSALEALGLRKGETVAVKVAAMMADGLARLMIGTATLDVKPDRPLTAGATLALTVQEAGQTVKLVLSDPTVTARQGSPPREATAQPRGSLVPTAGVAGASAPAVPQRGALPLQQTSPAAAVVDLLARGLLSAAGALAQAVEEPPSPQRPGTAPPADGAGQGSDPAALKGAVTAGVRSAAGRQESLATLFADLTAASRGDTARRLPPAVATAVADVLALRTDPERLASPTGLKAALGNAGTLLEARLATLPDGMPLPPDLKAALQRLKTALDGWTASLPDSGSDASVPKAASHERPPVRGMPAQGQPPQPSTIGDGVPARDLARILTDRTEAAMARLVLVQAASLPEARDGVRADPPPATTFEVPVRLGPETAVAQFQIQRDPPDPQERRAPSQSPSRGWTMRLGLDAEPLGPLHAAIRWRDGRVGVEIWAERPSTAATLEAQRGTLSEALEASAFAVERLVIAEGRPPAPRPGTTPPHRLDVTS